MHGNLKICFFTTFLVFLLLSPAFAMNDVESKNSEILCLYQGILAMSGEFGDTSSGTIRLYSERTPEYYQTLRLKYPVIAAAGEGDTQTRAINLLQWVYKNNYHQNRMLEKQECNAINVFAKTFGKDRDNGLNCVCLSTALTDCLQAAGISARTISCRPYNPFDPDMHVISIAYIPERSCWIMLDPTYNAYIMNERNEVLAPWDMRKLLSECAVIKCAPGTACHNEDSVAFKTREEDYIRYIAKNSFFYCDNSGYSYNLLEEDQRTYLLPKGFDYIAYLNIYINSVAIKIGDD